jgi:hypothetical protein
MLSALVGAVLGGAVGYVLFTERGADLRARYQPHLDGILGDAMQWQGGVAKLGGWGRIASLISGLGRHDDWGGEHRPHSRPH